MASGDINGDGRGDWVLGIAAANEPCSAGEVQVWYSNFGDAQPDEFWHRDAPDVQGSRECGAGFGAAVAIGDFNGDGYDDIAVGVPGDTVLDKAGVGTVHVLYGSREGLVASGDQILDPGHAEGNVSFGESSSFGTALAAGDFDCDGYADLAIGAPGVEVGALNAGVAVIVHGSEVGLSSPGRVMKYDDLSEMVTSANDHFGSFMAAGNINGDAVNGYGCDDLVVGVPGASVPNTKGITLTAAGAVVAFYGGPSGLDRRAGEVWHQGLLEGLEAHTHDQQFGRGVWLIDDDGDGFLDLVAYSHGSDAMTFVYGTAGGLTVAGARFSGPAGAAKGWARKACIWACQLAWTLLPPGPTCDCSACDILQKKKPSEPCAYCA
jgi:hypothetical protein